MAERLRLSRAKGFRLPAGTLNVARPGKLGNPFVVGKHGTRAECVSMFAMLAAGYIDLGSDIGVDEQLAMARRLRRIGREAGRNVACWCSLDGPCHGDVILHLANGGSREGLARFQVPPARSRILMRARDLEKMPCRAADPKGQSHG